MSEETAPPEQEPQPRPEEQPHHEVGALTSMIKRVQAEFVNYKARVERDRKQSIEQSNRDLIMQLIPILDIFDLALHNAQENETTRGFKMVHDQLLEVLKRQGVEVIDKTKVEVNPEIHEVMGESSVEGDPHKVCAVIKKGYKLYDRVLRAATITTYNTARIFF